MAGDRLNEGAQVGPSHTEHKRPTFLGIEVTVCQDEKTFILLWLKLMADDYIEKIFCVELLPFSVASNPCLNHFIFF